jgi:CubicO group peptidase (beta-lactamase class C family)
MASMLRFREAGDKRITGVVQLVVRRGQMAWFKAQGMSDREAAIAVRPDEMFRICSVTQPITGQVYAALNRLRKRIAQFGKSS